MNSKSLAYASATLFTLTFLAFSPHASAASLASESFESYATGSLSSQAGGGTGWTGSWTAPGGVTRAEVVDTTGNPLDFSPAGGAKIDGATRALEVGIVSGQTPASQLAGVRQLASPIAQTFYVGYLVRYEAGAGFGVNNTFSLHLGTNATSTTTFNFGMRSGTGTDPSTLNNFMLRYATGTPVAGAATGGLITPGTDYYLVAKLNFNSGVFDTMNVWLNPDYSDATLTPGGDASLTITGTDLPTSITHVFFRQAALQADDVFRADNIRIGTAWSDVVAVPEPGSLTLLALGGIATLLLVRRRS